MPFFLSEVAFVVGGFYCFLVFAGQGEEEEQEVRSVACAVDKRENAFDIDWVGRTRVAFSVRSRLASSRRPTSFTVHTDGR